MTLCLIEGNFNLTCVPLQKYLSKFDLDPSVVLDSGKFNKLDELLPAMKERVSEKSDRECIRLIFLLLLLQLFYIGKDDY